MKRFVAIMVLIFILLTPAACRFRLTDEPQTAPPETEPATAPTTTAPPVTTAPPQATEPVQSTEPPHAQTEEPRIEAQTDATAPEAVSVPDSATADEPGGDGEEAPAPPAAEQAGEGAVTLSAPSEVAGETNLSDDGDGALGTIIDNGTGLLSRGLGSLYECERAYVYFETADGLTVNRSSPEHTLILESGGYNVAEKLDGEALAVDGGWVTRKNPTVIVKCVGPDVLGAAAESTARAAAAAADILARPDWEGVSAVLNRRVVLLSQELLSSDGGLLLAKLYIANAMYPSLFSAVDIAGLCEQISQAGGEDFTTGVFAYFL